MNAPWDAGTKLLRKLRPDTARELGVVEPPREVGTERETGATDPPREFGATDTPRDGATDPPRELGATDTPREAGVTVP